MHAERRKRVCLAGSYWPLGCSKRPAQTGRRQIVQVKGLTWSVPSAQAQAANWGLPASSETWPATWSLQRTLAPELQERTALGGMPGCRLLVACRHHQGMTPGHCALHDLPVSSGNIGRSGRAKQVPSESRQHDGKAFS